ncbi:binding-protein-dependent transport systems inner membrane component [Paenibacillus mucilaginosus 3016]|uniref:Binding-protein-dependent transport systems inner membrane component n=2 Tax=Paenibacillus mucilaginosus TaxID=61624 RepID=H6NF17_9BACL|nr:carbohydrate ABC transporter permease [Paenibacillus mucilaginosus]AFC29024.1 binding-protein-dependent transport systems inner membrane component [Paenibacillus mucilaginosus 3016]AFH61235.2 ABC transporter permease [Paenibacillus mucilaginosus K02]WFA17765.1 carbohydrate ABC transporter permease [Paenibacillus mucilaginosus]
MVERYTLSRKMFIGFNYMFLALLSALCILPLIHVLAVSFSSSSAAAAGYVKLWPVEFTLESYKYVLGKEAFFDSILMTIQRVAVGLTVNMLLTILVAYPLSKEVNKFRGRTVYAWVFVFTMLFNGGLIPLYMMVKYTGILDTVWALVLPQAVPIFNMILLLNFFRGLPKELEEAAFMDGAGHWTTLWKVYVPLSAPALATITLFTMVFHWNSWFDGLIFMNSPENYPLQSYLQTVVIQQNFNNASLETIAELSKISDRTFKSAQIFLGSLPILLVYPFLQRFFMSGIVLGSVKE